ncbi:hypothetical protein E2C01_024166 [Portunus trituberculatus]|uniref:Uncharacterized protein n=1 Tax=Portunus trituberculatus TaxID=210409 RepID=A0A5B7ED44_PORTR|nr:hypothetical protein [Portunus trituberculatus]
MAVSLIGWLAATCPGHDTGSFKQASHARWSAESAGSEPKAEIVQRAINCIVKCTMHAPGARKPSKTNMSAAEISGSGPPSPPPAAPRVNQK